MQLNIKLADKTNKLVDATLLQNTPIKCFVHHDATGSGSWVVSEFFSGMKIISPKHTRKEAIESALFVFEQKSLEEIKKMVNEGVRRFGFANKDGTQRVLKKNAFNDIE